MSSRRGLVLFDIDGTILAAGDRHHGAAFTHAFEQVYGRPVTLEGVPLAGMLDAQIARILFERHGLDATEADARLEEMMAAMGERYTAAIAGQSLRERLLPGVTEAVLASHHHGWAVGALTGNGRAVGEAKLRGAGLGMLITFGAWGDRAVERGHLVDEAIAAAEQATGARYAPDETVLVGDTPADITAARLGGAHIVAVATGRFDTASLAAHRPDAILEDLSDTAAFVAAVGGALG
ncbi:MAG TPA: haloacid dehalogenase-like hydrolase [Thermomicrobiales bacterium]|nr:haloacid dehalogenase-like hydrolase [Thermomicrobiales bacterium]